MAAFQHYRELRERARAALGRAVGAPPEQVALTSSTTQGVGIVISGIDWKPGDEVLTTTEEHPGIRSPLDVIARRVGRARRGAAARAAAGRHRRRHPDGGRVARAVDDRPGAGRGRDLRRRARGRCVAAAGRRPVGRRDRRRRGRHRRRLLRLLRPEVAARPAGQRRPVGVPGVAGPRVDGTVELLEPRAGSGRRLPRDRGSLRQRHARHRHRGRHRRRHRVGRIAARRSRRLAGADRATTRAAPASACAASPASPWPTTATTAHR